MYIVLDGSVEFSIDMMANYIVMDDAKELGKDLRMRDLPFRL